MGLGRRLRLLRRVHGTLTSTAKVSEKCGETGRGTLAGAARTARRRDELRKGLGRLGRSVGTISWRDDREKAPDRHQTGLSQTCAP